MKLIDIDSSVNLPKYKQIVLSIERAIEEKRLAKNERLPSINKICLAHDISRDTVLLAFAELKKRGVIYSILGKGYFVKTIHLNFEMSIFLLFDELNAFKEEIYQSFVQKIGEKAKVDIYFHHFDSSMFRKLIDDSRGNYSKYIIMPSNLTNVDDIIKTLPKNEVYILDQTNENLTDFPSVHQNFEKEMYSSLVKGLDKICKYKRLILLFPGQKEPIGMVKGFERFCAEHQFNHAVLPSFEPKKIDKGTIFITPSDRHLVEIIEKGKAQNFELGSDYGIISFNDTPLKKVVGNGITTISTDFGLMGKTLAKMILTNGKKQIENPSELILRESL
ncbi:MAG: GntR family transcriptional regulator [Crocinitomicaceae bacterium]